MMLQESEEQHGKQAALLNKIIETPGLKLNEVQERLVEVLGHTPFQVIVGAIIGVVIRTYFLKYLVKKLYLLYKIDRYIFLLKLCF